MLANGKKIIAITILWNERNGINLNTSFVYFWPKFRWAMASEWLLFSATENRNILYGFFFGHPVSYGWPENGIHKSIIRYFVILWKTEFPQAKSYVRTILIDVEFIKIRPSAFTSSYGEWCSNHWEKCTMNEDTQRKWKNSKYQQPQQSQ